MTFLEKIWPKMYLNPVSDHYIYILARITFTKHYSYDIDIRILTYDSNIIIYISELIYLFFVLFLLVNMLRESMY